MAGLSLLGLGVGLALAACNTGASSAAGAASASAVATSSAGAPASTAPPAASSPAATSAPAATTSPATAAGASLVPMQTAAGGEFLSPSGNISCEVDYHRAGLTQVYCQSGTPAWSVTMTTTGSYTTCKGQQCLGNPGTGTPTLAYGKATGAGPFRCESATTGVTCLAGGKGFRISTAGIAPASA